MRILIILCIGIAGVIAQSVAAQTGQKENIKLQQPLVLYSSVPHSDEYKGTIREIFKTGRYGFDPIDLNQCNFPFIKPLSELMELPAQDAGELDFKMQGMSGDELWALQEEVAEESIAAEKKLKLEWAEKNSSTNRQLTATNLSKYNAMIMRIVSAAAEKGHKYALNEVGAAQLYCYNGVHQDVPAAVHALERASAQGDAKSMMSLGKIYSSGLGGFSNKAKGRQLEDAAFELFIQDLRANRLKQADE